jgi:hypothetical protein
MLLRAGAVQTAPKGLIVAMGVVPIIGERASIPLDLVREPSLCSSF